MSMSMSIQNDPSLSNNTNKFKINLLALTRKINYRHIDNMIKTLIPNKQHIIESDILSDNKQLITINKEKKKNELKERNEEYLLSIHSTHNKSNHIKANENIIYISSKDLSKSDICIEDISEKIEDITEKIEKNKINTESISFSGGGYNCMYHMGVLRYIFENTHLFKNTIYLGASGGAGICAIALCFESDPDRLNILKQMICDVIAIKSKKLNKSDQVKEYIANLINHITEEKFFKYIKGSDRCRISVTRISPYIFQLNEIKTNFISYVEFIETIKASACIPIILDDQIRKINNNKYIDGGLSNNFPSLNKNTIRISCLPYTIFKPHIYPTILFQLKYCFTPPDKNYILNMCDLGYNDIDKFMKDKKDKYDQLNKDN